MNSVLASLALPGQSCPTVEVSVVNASNQAVMLKGFSQSVSIDAHESVGAAIQTAYFYQRCGRLTLKVGDHGAQMAIISPQVRRVDIRINPDGSVEQAGAGQAGFNAKTYIEWHGIGYYLIESQSSNKLL